MPARIYALAKELKVDSKDLVDLVKKVGITGKGSALASLSDEEAQKVRDHLSGAGKPEPVAAPAATAAPTAVRDVVPTERKHVAIKVGRSSSRNAAPEKPATPAPQTPAPVEPVAESAVVPAVSEESDSPAASGTPAPQTPKPGSLGSRIKNRMGARKGGAAGADPVAPVRRDSTVSGGKMRSLDRPAATGEKRSDSAKAKRREPRINVKMASLPEVAEPKPSKQASGEPKAQKPDVKLSKDVIAGHRQGMRAPLEELAKEEKESKRSASAKRGSGLSGFTGEKKREAGDEDKPRRKLAGMASPRGGTCSWEKSWASCSRTSEWLWFTPGTLFAPRAQTSQGCQYCGAKKRCRCSRATLHDPIIFRSCWCSRRKGACNLDGDGTAGGTEYQFRTRS